MAGLMLQPLARYGLSLFLLAAACSTENRSSGRGQPVTTGALSTDGGVPSAPVYDPCPATGPCLIMPLGDSLTSGTDGQEGYRGELFRLLQATGRPFDFVGSQPSGGFGSGQEGHPNAHIDLLTVYADIWIPMYKPNVILFMIGVNDLDQFYLDHVTTYAKILDRIVALEPQAVVAVALIPTNTATPEIAIGFNTALAQAVNTRIAAGKHLVLADMHSTVRQRDLSADGVHPVHAGYVRVAQVWHSVLSRFMRAH